MEGAHQAAHRGRRRRGRAQSTRAQRQAARHRKARMTSSAPSFVARGATPSMVRRAVDRRGLAIFTSATAAALLLACVALFAIWARTRVTAAGYALDKAVREHQELLRKREALTVQVAELKAPGRLQAVAKKLGMGPPTADRTVVIVEGPLNAVSAVPERAVVAAHR